MFALLMKSDKLSLLKKKNVAVVFMNVTNTNKMIFKGKKGLNFFLKKIFKQLCQISRNAKIKNLNMRLLSGIKVSL